MIAIFQYLLLLAIGVGILVKSADWFTEASVAVARRLHVPELIVGVTLVSLATTLPEFAVSFSAAWVHKAQMAVGNAIGSTICNIGLILGLCSLLSPMPVEQKDFRHSGFFLLGIAGLFAVLAFLFPAGGRWIGLVLLASLGIYLYDLVRRSLKSRSGGMSGEEKGEKDMGIGKIILLFITGAIGVVGGSRLVVYCAEHIARAIGISELIISLTLVAIGTSTPELVVSLTAVLKKSRALSIGNIIGANILNIAWVLGSCSLLQPLPLQHQTLIFDIPVMLLLTVLLLVFGISGQKVKRWEGGVLFSIYGFYLFILAMKFIPHG